MKGLTIWLCWNIFSQGTEIFSLLSRLAQEIQQVCHENAPSVCLILLRDHKVLFDLDIKIYR